MTTIRPDLPPPSGHGPQAQDHGKLAAQRLFFAALAQARGAAAPAPAPAQALAQPATQTVTAQPPEATQKIPRPGSLFDIRV